MPFKKIDYLRWYKRSTGSVKFDLSSSCLKAATSDDLGLTMDDVLLDIRGGIEPYFVRFRESIAKLYGTPVERVALVPSVTTGYFLLFAALQEKGNEIILESPNYESLYKLPVYFQSRVRVIERPYERNFQLDIEQLERKINKNTTAIVLTNLHNPTGVSTNPDKLMAIGQLARAYKANVVSAEVYLDNAFDPFHKPAATYGDNMISINGFSKVYGLHGLRIAWIVANEAIISRIAEIADYVTGNMTSLPSLSIAVKALSAREKLLERSRAIVKGNLTLVNEWLKRRGDIRFVPPEGGTVCFVKLPQRLDAVKFCDLLLKKYATLVVPGDFFWTKGFVRIGLGGNGDVLGEGLKNIDNAMNEMISKA